MVNSSSNGQSSVEGSDDEPSRLKGARAMIEDEHTGPKGAMVVFGGESVEECYLNDVWMLHLNSLQWQQLSKAIACQKRCCNLLERH